VERSRQGETILFTKRLFTSEGGRQLYNVHMQGADRLRLGFSRNYYSLQKAGGSCTYSVKESRQAKARLFMKLLFTCGGGSQLYINKQADRGKAELFTKPLDTSGGWGQLYTKEQIGRVEAFTKLLFTSGGWGQLYTKEQTGRVQAFHETIIRFRRRE
jgi:hypothetical protein